MEPVGTAGQRLGRYHLGELVGGGPTGEVFRARVHGVAGFERQFALKRFHSQLVANEGARTRLRTAARLYAALEHPRIARLHEHNFETATPYVAVEWIAGLDLARLVEATFGQGRPIPAGAATSILSRAARAVGYAHGRGHAHLGLAPTNLLCTPSGEIKVTDFGFLPARLSSAPGDDATLLARLGYLAPEQLRGEATSPASDVFCLGTLFYELLTGERAFSGRTGRDISAAIQGGKPATDAIPKPLARVLERCFAQSPFERYPSGGALADAIDAAGRGMLMRGDQRDAAKAVQAAMERLEQLRSQQVSGVLSFPIPSPPTAELGSAGSSAAIASQRSFGVPNLELDEAVRDEATTDVRPVESISKRSPAELELDNAPPTIPSVPSVPSIPSSPTSSTGSPPTMPPPSVGPPPLPPPVTPGLRPGDAATAPGQRPPAPNAGAPVSARPPTPPPLPPMSPPLPPMSPPPLSSPPRYPSFEPIEGKTTPFDRTNDSSPSIDDALTARELPMGPPPMRPPEAPVERPPSNFGAGLIDAGEPSNLGRRALIALTMLALGAIGFFGFLLIFDSGDKPEDATPQTTQNTQNTAAIDAATVPAARDAAPKPTVIDAASPDEVDAGPAILELSSDPKRATVYLDGTKVGRTPLTLETARDQHKLVVVRPGHDIHIADIVGGGKLHIELAEVTPSGGRAGIKVRCREKRRYYVWVDGNATGQLCPTERIEVDLGKHLVEVYDPITDTRRRFDIDVTQTRRSHRIRIDF